MRADPTEYVRNLYLQAVSSQNAELRLRFEILVMEIARDLFTVPARPGSRFSRLNSKFPAVSAGAGTWVCGIWKTNQMVTGVENRCKRKENRTTIGSRATDAQGRADQLSLWARATGIGKASCRQLGAMAHY